MSSLIQFWLTHCSPLICLCCLCSLSSSLSSVPSIHSALLNYEPLKGIMVIDEAYIKFLSFGRPTSNRVTIRLGIVIAQSTQLPLMQVLSNIKALYNISTPQLIEHYMLYLRGSRIAEHYYDEAHLDWLQESWQLAFKAIRTADLRGIEEPHSIKDQKRTKGSAITTWAEWWHQVLRSSLAYKTALTKPPDGRPHPMFLVRQFTAKFSH
ncbi:hypothetical protein EI94DRAFT_1892571 [Lactarius quietus]|nr:hypothetical protein EI94DRAFT_1892571 [Lactarius quietus]